MAKKLFNTIYGRNLVGELKNIVQRPYLVVTMEDLWEKFKDEFDEDCIVHFVKTLEYNEIMANVEKLPKFEAVIGLGGGQAVDYAKMCAWKTHMPLYQVPTSIATNAVFGHRAGVRFDSVVRYVGYVEPVAVYVDYDVIQSGPRALNRSGVCDVLCYNNSMFDWKYAADQGKCEEKWPYDQEMVDEVNEVFQSVPEWNARSAPARAPRYKLPQSPTTAPWLLLTGRPAPLCADQIGFRGYLPILRLTIKCR